MDDTHPRDGDEGSRRDPEDPTRREPKLRPVAGPSGDLRWIHERPEVSRWWDEPGEGLSWDEPDSTRLTIFVDGQIGGMIQYWEEDGPSTAGIDLFIDPALHNKGIAPPRGPGGCRYLFEARGHHRLEIDPAENLAAIRVYEGRLPSRSA